MSEDKKPIPPPPPENEKTTRDGGQQGRAPVAPRNQRIFKGDRNSKPNGQD